MKPRYNLRIQPLQVILSSSKNKKTPSSSSSSTRVTKPSQGRRSEPLHNAQTRRHSLRLTPSIKTNQSLDVPKWHKVENDNDHEMISNSNDEDNFDELLARHRRLMLEEQKDRKLYERYVRDQRTLRRLQCRRTHTAHLNESTRKRLLRELERERRYEIHQKICAYLANRTILFRHGSHKDSKQAMTWSNLEEELSYNRNIGTIHELDVMIDNLKRVTRTSSTSLPKPRLSVRERQNQRLKTLTPVRSDVSQVPELHSSPVSTNPTIHSPSQFSFISYSPRVPLVRFTDDSNLKLRTSNSQRLTCIQNVLAHQNRIVTNEGSTPIGIRKSFLRQKSSHSNFSDSSSPPTKKRALEKENCSVLAHSSSNHPPSDILLRTTSPMVSFKHTSSSSSSRVYPNTRKHPIIQSNSLTTRRYTRLSANG